MSELVPIIEAQRGDFVKVCCDKNINFDREAGFALQILNANEYLGRVAMNNKPSIVNAVNNVAAIGISLNPASKLAYLVPRKGAVCLDISYIGMMHLAQVTGAIQWGQAVIVRANDTFTLNGVDKQPTHVFSPFDSIEKRGEIVGCYVVIKTEGGDFLTHTMTAVTKNAYQGTYNFEIFAVKSRVNLSLQNFEQLAHAFLSKYNVNDTPTQKRMLEAWMKIYRQQIEVSWAVS